MLRQQTLTRMVLSSALVCTVIVSSLLSLQQVQAGRSMDERSAPYGRETNLYSPKYNEVYGIATHNSYYINRSDALDFAASGTQELLTDQLLHDHVRALELDAHSEGAAPGVFRIFHTSSSENFSCNPLDECLQMLRNVQYAIPQHDVINVIVELKNVHDDGGGFGIGVHTHRVFDATHSVEQFDNTFRSILGASLYTPADFLARCPGITTLVACSREVGWPTIDQLRGKFIINVIGNWSEAARDWAYYAVYGRGVIDRVAFPVRSIFADDGSGIDTRLSGPEPFPYQWTLTARDQSIFWQVEDLNPKAPGFDIADFLTNVHGVIRSRVTMDYGRLNQYVTHHGHPTYQNRWCDDHAYDIGCQEDRISSGMQLIQTDYPWHFVHNDAWSDLGIPTDPSQRLYGKGWLTHPDAPPNGGYPAPGARLYFSMPAPYWAYAYADVPPVAQRWWEATVSTTRRGDTAGLSYPRLAQDNGEGGIRVENDLGQYVDIERRKEAQPGDSYYQEGVHIRVAVGNPGRAPKILDFAASRYTTCPVPNLPNSDDTYRHPQCVGSLIALSVSNGSSVSIVRVYSAGRLNVLGTPLWQLLDTEVFNAPMTRQGYRATQDVLFAGTRMASATSPIQLGDIGLAELPHRIVQQGGPPPNIADLTVRVAVPAPSPTPCPDSATGMCHMNL